MKYWNSTYMYIMQLDFAHYLKLLIILFRWHSFSTCKLRICYTKMEGTSCNDQQEKLEMQFEYLRVP